MTIKIMVNDDYTEFRIYTDKYPRGLCWCIIEDGTTYFLSSVEVDDKAIILMLLKYL